MIFFLFSFCFFSSFVFAEQLENNLVTISKKNFVSFHNYLDVLLALDRVCVNMGGDKETCGSYSHNNNRYFDNNEPSVIYDYVKSNLDKLQGNNLKYVRRLLALFTNTQDYLRICVALLEDKFKFKNYKKGIHNSDITNTINDYEEESEYRRRYFDFGVHTRNNNEAYRRCSVKKIEKINEMAKNLDKAECMDALRIMEIEATTLFSYMSQFFRSRDRNIDRFKHVASLKYRKIMKEDYSDLMIKALSAVRLNIETQLANHKCKHLWQNIINQIQISSHNNSNVEAQFNSSYTSSAPEQMLYKELLPKFCQECNYTETSIKKEFAEIIQDIQIKQYKLDQEIWQQIDDKYDNSPEVKKYSKLAREKGAEVEEKIEIFCKQKKEEIKAFENTETDREKFRHFAKLKLSECEKFKNKIKEEENEYLDKIAEKIHKESIAKEGETK